MSIPSWPLFHLVLGLPYDGCSVFSCPLCMTTHSFTDIPLVQVLRVSCFFLSRTTMSLSVSCLASVFLHRSSCAFGSTPGYFFLAFWFSTAHLEWYSRVHIRCYYRGCLFFAVSMNLLLALLLRSCSHPCHRLLPEGSFWDDMIP